jgi:hypothetical protein
VASFDFDAAVRWARAAQRSRRARRFDAELPFVDGAQLHGQPLLLDTCVYIDQAQERAPDLVHRLVGARHVNHSTVALQELMHLAGVLDPTDDRTPKALATIRNFIRSMKPHRLSAPDVDVLGRAALLAGMLCRLQGYGADRKFRALQDCTLFLQAQKLGFAILTANLADFDILMQLQPAGRVLFYRRA